MTTAIDVQAVSKHYGKVIALDSLNLQVDEGEIFGLLGANGAGKTTLIKILTGILPADSGTLRVIGLDPKHDKVRLRQQLGYMPQQPALYDDLTARDNVRFFAQARPTTNLEKRVGEVLDFLALTERVDDPVYTFSGGMKQRVSLACALVHAPRLLLLDEPSTGVDPKLRESLWNHFRDLAQQGVTILVSTHQMDEALHCDRVAVMRAGQVLAANSPRGLLATGHSVVTLWRGEQSERFELHDYRRELPPLLQEKGVVDRIELHEDTLEDVVLRLINQQEKSHV